MPIQIQLRRGSSSEWASTNPIIAEGEVVLETDTGKFKVGNGISQYTDLPYGGISGPDGSGIHPFFLYRSS